MRGYGWMNQAVCIAGRGKGKEKPKRKKNPLNVWEGDAIDELVFFKGGPFPKHFPIHLTQI